jgi:hypothetical protein
MEGYGNSKLCQSKARAVPGPPLQAVAAFKPALHACGRLPKERDDAPSVQLVAGAEAQRQVRGGRLRVR